MNQKIYGDGYVTIDEWLKNSIENRLTFYKGSVAKVAKSLGLSRPSCYRHIHRFDINFKEFKKCKA